jgi:ribose 5-phosphate isomerase B
MIAIGNDHAGLGLKKEIAAFLEERRVPYRDFGTNSAESVDYPAYAIQVAQALLRGECEKGILICGTGIGISITANRLPGIRAALCHDVFSAKASRRHNDANILAMGGRVVGAGLAAEIVQAFLETEFSGEERHLNRIRQMEDAACSFRHFS